MIINSYIDAQDAIGFAPSSWYFVNSVNSGNNSGIIFIGNATVILLDVDVQDSYATPAFWFASGASVNSGNNTNWIFDTSNNPYPGGIPPAFGFGFRI
jgi:hypothetical protein